MVGVNAYATVAFNDTRPQEGYVLPGSYNVATAIQDPANINAGLLRVNFAARFLYPPVITVTPVRVGIEWVSPGNEPFMPDGSNRQRDVFPMPPAYAAVAGEVDEIAGVPVARVYESGALPVDGRPMPTSSRIEMETQSLQYRLMFVERTHFVIQFASYLGKVVEFRPVQLDGTTGTDDVQRGVIREIMFNFIACGNVATV